MEKIYLTNGKEVQMYGYPNQEKGVGYNRSISDKPPVEQKTEPVKPYNKFEGYPDWNNYSSAYQKDILATGSRSGVSFVVIDKTGKEYPMNAKDFHDYWEYLQGTRNK